MTSCLHRSLDDEALPKGVNFLRKEFASTEANSFLKELTPFGKGCRNGNGRVASPENVPSQLK